MSRTMVNVSILLGCLSYYTMLTLLFSTLPTVEASRILMIPMFVKSHLQGQVAIAMELAGRGHDVHMFFPTEMSVPAEITDTQGLGAVVMHIYSRPSLHTTTDFEEVNTTKGSTEKMYIYSLYNSTRIIKPNP